MNGPPANCVFVSDLHAAKKHTSNWKKMNTIKKVSQEIFGNRAHSIAQWINEHLLVK